MNLRNIAATSGVSLILAGSMAFAQAPTNPPASTPDTQTQAASAHAPNPRRQLAKLQKELSLTPDQTAKVEPILADRDQKIAALRADTSVTPDAMKKQMHAIQKSTRDQLSSVLTPQQMEQLKSIQHENGGKGQPTPLAPAA